MSGKVIKKIVYKVPVCLASPLCVSVGGADSELTDDDVIRDYEGRPFVPGSSIAGAMRAYLEQKKDSPGIFGYAGKKGDGKMSSLFISDLEFETKRIPTEIRDSVKLMEDAKIAERGAKFDMEVVDTGTAGHFYIELVIREGEDEAGRKEQIEQLLRAVNTHEIRFGRKKTRGYGCLHIGKKEEGVFQYGIKEFNGENIEEYAKAYEEDFVFKKRMLPDSSDRRHIGAVITVPLKLTGGISIRQYSAEKDEADYAHITADGKPVIPGTSVAGAVRSRLREILRYDLDLPKENREKILEEMFGYVKEGGARISRVIFDECVLEGAKPLITVRTAISRFEASVKDGALYKEQTYVGGETTMTITIQKDEKEKEWIRYLLLVILDLANGYLGVGGQTAIGRGLFETAGDAAESVKINGEAVRYENYGISTDKESRYDG